MEQKKIYSWLNPRQTAKGIKTGPSCTIPTDTMSIRTIMDRYARGMPLSIGQKQPQYYNGEFPDIQGLDLTEIAALKRAADQNVKDIQQKLQQQENSKKQLAQIQLENKIKDLQNQLKAQGNQARGKVEGDSPNPIS